MVKAKKMEVIQRSICAAMVFIMAMFMLFIAPFQAHAAGGLELSTDYPGMSVKPGDNLSIPITLNNYSGAGMDADVSVSSLPEGWEGYLQGGSYQVSKVHVKDGAEGAKITLHITVPKEASEGTYTASVHASSASGAAADQTLTFNINEMKAGKGSFSSEYPQQEGASGTNFSFSTTLINNGLTSQSYSLSSNAPAGWTIGFTPSGESTKIAGIDVESGAGRYCSRRV